MLSLDCHVLVDVDEPYRFKDHLPRIRQVQGQSQMARAHPPAEAGVQTDRDASTESTLISLRSVTPFTV